MTKVLRSILAACLVGVVACEPGEPPAGPGEAPDEQEGAGALEQELGEDGALPPPPPVEWQLLGGVPVPNLSGAASSEQHFIMQVPTEQTSLTFQLSGGTGDADLYVRQGGRATTSSYHCRPYLAGNSESCTFTNPMAGYWYVMLRGYSSYAGATLVGNFSSRPPPTGPQLELPNLQGATGSTQTWMLQVPPGARTLTFRIAGGQGDADLYVLHGSAPTTSSFKCRPYLKGNDETCTFDAPSPGNWYVMLRGYSAYRGVTLTGQY